jgi:hypothetical protein
MTLSICPLCGEALHGLPNMKDARAWYAEHHPDLTVGSVIPDVCSDCSHQYAEGERLVHRDRIDATIYSVSSLLCRQDQPPLINATSPDGHVRYFAVTQVRPYRERAEITDAPGEREPGYF